MEGGWIKLFRKIQDNPYYLSEPFTRGQAWIDMILIANHREGIFYKRGIKVIVGRGQIGWDVETIASRWKWSRGKVERYFKELEIANQIVRQKTNVTTLISLINYEEYQGEDDIDSKPNDKPSSKPDGQQTVNQTDTNKNDKKKKNDKNDKNDKKVGDHLFKDSEFFEYEKFQKEFEGTDYEFCDLKIYHEKVKNWSASKGAKRKDWIATARNFMLSDKEDGKLILKQGVYAKGTNKGSENGNDYDSILATIYPRQSG